MICTHTWFLSHNQMRAVPQDDPDAYFLLVQSGDDLDNDMAEKWDIPRLEAEMSAKALQRPPENKAVSMPPQVKRQKPRLVKRARH